ncbi:MAG TPA: hypothetical protein VKT77_23495, partial [Chthonomonadaceae bacterium]|nr:hypothetical protein [Chthonomonadaceae bacterium]
MPSLTSKPQRRKSEDDEGSLLADASPTADFAGPGDNASLREQPFGSLLETAPQSCDPSDLVSTGPSEPAEASLHGTVSDPVAAQPPPPDSGGFLGSIGRFGSGMWSGVTDAASGIAALGKGAYHAVTNPGETLDKVEKFGSSAIDGVRNFDYGGAARSIGNAAEFAVTD